MVNSIFGKRLKGLRNKRGMTQQKLSEFLDVGRATVAGYETKGKEPSFDILLKLSNIFNVSTDYLLGNVDNPEVKIIPKENLPVELANLVDYIEILKEAEISEISPEELRSVIDFAKKIKKNNN